jgi:hypothetical protein
VLDHLDDLDADFRVFYGLDIDRDDIDGPTFFALARRVFAYGGVMAARFREQQAVAGDPDMPQVPAARPAGAPGMDEHTRRGVLTAHGTEDAKVVSLDAFRMQFPDVIG